MALAERVIETTSVQTSPQVQVKDSVQTIPQIRVQTHYLRNSIIALVVVALLATATIVTSMMVTNKNRQLQDIQSNTTLMQRKNDTLLQSVQELSQYDRVNRIAKEKGLTINENNVRNVDQ